jgi:hypothetical protein
MVQFPICVFFGISDFISETMLFYGILVYTAINLSFII